MARAAARYRPSQQRRDLLRCQASSLQRRYVLCCWASPQQRRSSATTCNVAGHRCSSTALPSPRLAALPAIVTITRRHVGLTPPPSPRSSGIFVGLSCVRLTSLIASLLASSTSARSSSDFRPSFVQLSSDFHPSFVQLPSDFRSTYVRLPCNVGPTSARRPSDCRPTFVQRPAYVTADVTSCR